MLQCVAVCCSVLQSVPQHVESASHCAGREGERVEGRGLVWREGGRERERERENERECVCETKRRERERHSTRDFALFLFFSIKESLHTLKRDLHT